MSLRTAVILAGGLGTRLHPFTVAIPKPLLPIGHLTILEVVVHQLAARGFERIVLTLGHLPHLFFAILGDGSRWGITIEYIEEASPLGTAGSVRAVADLPDTFLVMNGDVLTTLDYLQMFDSHLQSGAAATIAVKRRTVDIDFGVLEIADSGALVEYREKPTITYAVSMGVNILSRPVVELIPEEVKFDMPDLMRSIMLEGSAVNCYSTVEYWRDIGRMDDYQQACADFSGNPGQFLPGALIRP